MLGFFIVTFDAVVVNVALSSIRTDLGGGISGLQWVVDGYTLMFAALLLAAGAFSDRAGARRAFTVGVVVFVAASAACGLAPGLGTLVAARFVQGSASGGDDAGVDGIDRPRLPGPLTPSPGRGDLGHGWSDRVVVRSGTGRAVDRSCRGG